MNLPTTCRVCSSETSSDRSLYHSPHFNIYFEKDDVTDKFDIPEKSMVVYCEKCTLEKYKKAFFSNYSKCEKCGLLYSNNFCANCEDKEDDNCDIVFKGYQPRTCLKCDLTQEPLSEHERIEIDVGTCGGFPCDKKWILCENNIARVDACCEEYNIYEEKLNGFVCDTCFSKMDKTVRKPVVCDVCAVGYASINQSLNQGYDCAGYMTDAGISCGYGSLLDFNYYKWTEMLRPEEFRNCELICDKCIEELLSKNIIFLDHEISEAF